MALSVAMSAAAPGAAASVAAPGGALAGGNLLASARLSDSLDVSGPVASVADGWGGAEGGDVAPTQKIRFLTAAGSVTYDLGLDRPIVSAFVQAGAGNGYSLQVSDDGASFRTLWTTPERLHGPAGLRTRFESFEGVHARYVRFGEPSGPGSRQVAEVAVFSEFPAGWPTPPAVAPPVPPSPSSRTWAHFLRSKSGPIRLSLALLAAALLVWGRRLAARGAPARHARLRDALLIALAIGGYASYYEFGLLPRIHYYEFYHYYIGAKYFPELGYTHLYECSSLAEAEQGFRRRVELRNIRDLHRNELVSARYVLEDPDRFKQGFSRPFTAERWEAFAKDVAYFRSHVPIDAWERMLQDHGYNPSPVWNLTASLLANRGPATDRLIGLLATIDPILLLAMFACVVWAFGWRVAAVALVFFGTNEPALYFWTGGAFLRQDWLLFAVAGICLLKKGRPALAGASLAVSTLLRVFPVAFFVAIGLRLVWTLVRHRRLDPVGARIVAGAAIVTALLVPISSVVAGSASAWPEFARNTRKHANSPLTNYMGLRTMIGFRWETRQKAMVDPNAVDPFHDFKEARRRAFQGPAGEPLVLVLGVAYLGLLLWGLRREKEWWVLAAFGFGVIPMGLELTCYYYSFLMVAAFLAEKRPSIPIALLLVSASTYLVATATYYYDIRYFFMSGVVVAFVVGAAWLYGRRPASLEAGSTTSA